MIAWRVSSPACLPVVDFPMSSRRAWRGAGHIRPRFCLGGRFHARLVLPSRDAWLMSSADCFDDLLSCLLFACYHAPSRPSSRFSSRRASRCACLTPDVFFLCFLSRSPVSCACLICSSCPSRSVVSSSRLVGRLGRRRVVMCCLLDCPDSVLVSSLSPRRAGRGAERDTMRFRNRFHDVFMNW